MNTRSVDRLRARDPRALGAKQRVRWIAVFAAAALGVGLSATTAAADTETLLDSVGETGTTPAIDIVRYALTLDASTVTSTIYFNVWDRDLLDSASIDTTFSASGSTYTDFQFTKAAGGDSAVLTSDFNLALS